MDNFQSNEPTISPLWDQLDFIHKTQFYIIYYC